MGDTIKTEDREVIWITLADFFTTFPVELMRKELRTIARYPRDEIERVFFDEVAPACVFNLVITTPILSEGFDAEWIIDRIKNKPGISRTYAPLLCIRRLYYRWMAGDVWKEVERAVDELGKAP